MNKEEIKKALKKLRNEAIDIYMNAEDNSYEEIYHDGHSDAYDSALDFIDQLDEPDKIVMPEFVAEWWEQEGDSVKLYGGLRVEKKDKLDLISKLCDMWLDDHLLKVEDWIIENDSAFLDLVNGKPYEVEEGPKYYAKLKEFKPLEKEWLTNLTDPNYFAIDTMRLMLDEFTLDLVRLKTEASTYTLKDWRSYGINDLNADFVEVTE